MDEVYYTDEEKSQRVKDAAEREETARIELEESFRALGFDPGALGSEKVPQKARQWRCVFVHLGLVKTADRRRRGSSKYQSPKCRLLFSVCSFYK